jgi:8-oxo-dGTP diphosphatase
MQTTPVAPLEVVAAVIEQDGEILVCRRATGRSAAGKWEFPGGKIERGESATAALVREIREELQTEILVGGILRTDDTDVNGSTIRLICMSATLRSQRPTMSNDHDALEWRAPTNLLDLDWADPDLPMVKELASR